MTQHHQITKEEAEIRDAEIAEHNAREAAMTPAEKAARTRKANKAWAAHDERMAPIDAEYYGFCETLYPERNAAIDASEEEMQNTIAAARAKHDMNRRRIMGEFEDTTRPLREKRNAAIEASMAQVRAEGGF